MSDEPTKKPGAAGLIDGAERIVYFGAALFLLVTIGMVFFSAVTAFLEAAERGVLETALEVLDQILLVFIFAELLGIITTIVRENQVRVEPFLLIGLIAVVRRILLVTTSNRAWAPRNLPACSTNLGFSRRSYWRSPEPSILSVGTRGRSVLPEARGSLPPGLSQTVFICGV